MPSKSVGALPSAQETARYFHDTYERMSPHYGFVTNQEDRIDWMELPERRRKLLIETCRQMLEWLKTGRR